MTQVEGDTKRSPTLLSVAMTSTAAADDNVNPVGDSRIMPLSHPEEPLLNCIPAGVFPTYRPISLPLQLTLILLSLWTSATITWKQFTWLQPLALLRGMKKAPALSDFLAFTAKVSGLRNLSRFFSYPREITLIFCLLEIGSRFGVVRAVFDQRFVFGPFEIENGRVAETILLTIFTFQV
jgi:hypothetical protein